jgi:hypothetical protein
MYHRRSYSAIIEEERHGNIIKTSEHKLRFIRGQSKKNKSILILILVTGTIAITVAVRLLNLVHSDSVMTALDPDLHLHASSHKPTKANQEVAKDAAVKNAWYTLALIKLVPPLSKNIQMLYKRTYCQTDMVCHMLIRLLMGNEFLMSLRAFSTMPRGLKK